MRPAVLTHAVPPLPHSDRHSGAIELEGDGGAGCVSLPRALEAFRAGVSVVRVEAAVAYL